MMNAMIVIALGVFALVACGESMNEVRAETSGSCGDEVYWSYNVTTNTLTISGKGDMAAYSSSSSIPWASYRASIKTVVLSGEITSLSSSAFFRCIQVQTITLPETMKSIGSSAFSYCDSLLSLSIPKSLTSISVSGVFGGCRSLTAFTVDPENPSFKDVDGVLFNKEGTTLVAYPAAKPGVQYDIPDNVTFLANYAFSDSSNLTSINIPDSVTRIGFGVFQKCSSLTSLRIPANVTTIDSYAFDNCYNLTSIEVDLSNSVYASEDGVVFNKERTILLYYPPGKKGGYTVPDGVTKIQGNSFFSVPGLTSIKFPASVTEISGQPFLSCNNIETIIYLGTSNPGKRAFSMYLEPRFICVPLLYNSSEFCEMDGFCKSESCDDLSHIENNCFFATCKNNEWEVKKRDNATQWEQQIDRCFDNQCVNETGPQSWKRDNATLWEQQSNQCYEYLCSNESGLQLTLRDNYTKWEEQSNECYEYKCANGTAQSWKRDNATQWESQTNGCFEFQCNNESGFLMWSMCNSTDGSNHTCVNGNCIDGRTLNDKPWSVEIEIVGVKVTDVNITVLTSIITELTDICEDDFVIGLTVDDDGLVISIIIYVDSEKTAAKISDSVDGIDKNEDCDEDKYSALCRAQRAIVHSNQTIELSSCCKVFISLLSSIMVLMVSQV